MLVVDIEDLKDMLNDLEIFEVKFNKHGKWHNKNNKHWVCSECEGLAETARYCSKCDYDYCPNCGAKMDKE